MDYSLSVGYDGNFENLERIISVSQKVRNVYTGGIANFINGGRFQYASSIDSLIPHIEYANSKKVSYTIALNGSCGFYPKENTNWWKKVVDYLKELESIGVNSLVVSHPFLLRTAKENTDLKIIVSTMCEIKNVRSALYYEELGADVICPSTSINYDIPALLNIASSLKYAKLKILLNECCLGDCPFRQFHRTNLSHATYKGYDLDYTKSCKEIYSKNPYLFLTNNVIRPEDLKHYFEITNEFKLVGRGTDISTLCNMTKAYSDQMYDGNFLNLSGKHMGEKFYIDNSKLSELFDKKKTCSYNCSNCDFCQKLYSISSS